MDNLPTVTWKSIWQNSSFRKKTGKGKEKDKSFLEEQEFRQGTRKNNF
jgi:hypothetical protein